MKVMVSSITDASGSMARPAVTFNGPASNHVPAVLPIEGTSAGIVRTSSAATTQAPAAPTTQGTWLALRSRGPPMSAQPTAPRSGSSGTSQSRVSASNTGAVLRGADRLDAGGGQGRQRLLGGG